MLLKLAVALQHGLGILRLLVLGLKVWTSIVLLMFTRRRLLRPVRLTVRIRLALDSVVVSVRWVSRLRVQLVSVNVLSVSGLVLRLTR